MNSELAIIGRLAVIMRILSSTAIAFIFVLSLASGAISQQVSSSQLSKEEVKKAKRLYLRKTCIACHGKNGAKAIMDYPSLAGQDAKYMFLQVKDILKSKRIGSLDADAHPRTDSMRGALISPDGAIRITDEEIKLISNWLSSLPPSPIIALKEALSSDKIKEAEKLYKKKGCKTCHGVAGKKPLKTYPFIAGQKVEYLISQMQDIKSKARKNGRTKMMYPFAKRLSDDDITLLSQYLSQISREQK